MNISSKVQIKITISAENKGEVAQFIRLYTMKEHSDDQYIKDGEDYALENFNLKASQIVVQDWPVISKKLEAKIEKRWGSGDKVVPGQMAIPKVHNPMHSCFKAYRQFDLDGVNILIKPVSAGIVYAIQNDDWVNELQN